MGVMPLDQRAEDPGGTVTDGAQPPGTVPAAVPGGTEEARYAAAAGRQMHSLARQLSAMLPAGLRFEWK